MAQFLCNQSFRANLPISSIEKSLDIAIKENILEQLILIVPTGRLVWFLKNQITRKYFEIHKKPLIVQIFIHCKVSLLIALNFKQ
jgi:hypothetical protein